jgi:hypothetical protein
MNKGSALAFETKEDLYQSIEPAIAMIEPIREQIKRIERGIKQGYTNEDLKSQ